MCKFRAHEQYLARIAQKHVALDDLHDAWLTLLYNTKLDHFIGFYLCLDTEFRISWYGSHALQTILQICERG